MRFCRRTASHWIVVATVLTHRAVAFHPPALRFANRRFASMSSLPPLIDVDCNLLHADMKTLKSNGAESRAGDILEEDAVKESNIVAMLSPASTIEEAKQSLEMLERQEYNVELRTTVGVHPYHVNDEGLGFPASHYDEIKSLISANSKHVAAVGECGLDASEGFPPIEDQIPWFEEQVKVAQELNLPLFVHERLAFEETIRILDGVDLPIIIHCFTGNTEECQKYVEQGYFLSVSGFIAKDGGDEVRKCLEEGIIPLNKLMIETDAPYMGFDGSRERWLEKQGEFVESLNSKKRKRLQKGMYPNVPSSLPMVLDHVVECLNTGRKARGEEEISREDVADATTKNAIEFFGFKSR
jgi:TatD DNase family protein